MESKNNKSMADVIKIFLTETRKTFYLAFPMILGQLGHIFLMNANTAMVGRVGVNHLAAISFGGIIVIWLIITGMGLCAAVHVLVARSVGSNGGQTSEVLKHNMWISAIYGILLGSIVHFNIDLLEKLGQPADVVVIAKSYVKILGWVILPVMLFRTFRNYCEAWNNPWPSFFITLGIVAVSIFFSWVFIFGKFGIEPFGAEGVAIGSIIANWLGFFVLFIMVVISPRYALKWTFRNVFTVNWKEFKEQLKIGIPTSLQIAFEFGSVLMATFMMGWLGANELAAQQVTTSYTGFVFMIPLGISFAITIRIGQAVGARDPLAVRRVGFYGTALGAGVMMVVVIFTLLLRQFIPTLYTNDLSVIDIVINLLIIASVYQIMDGVQVVCMGALRGMADVVIPTIVVIASYWIIGLGAGYLMAFKLNFGAVGVWAGLAVGTIVVGCFHIWRFHRVTKNWKHK